MTSSSSSRLVSASTTGESQSAYGAAVQSDSACSASRNRSSAESAARASPATVSKVHVSTSEVSATSEYPAAVLTSRDPDRAFRSGSSWDRSRDTATWSAASDWPGASSPQTSATSRSAATGAPRAASRTARTPRSRRRVSRSSVPPTRIAMAPKAE